MNQFTLRIKGSHFFGHIRTAFEQRKFFQRQTNPEHKKLFDSKIFDHKELSFKMRKALVVLQKGLAQEREETRKMLAIYHKYTRGEASEQEMQEANEQFKDVIKGLGLSVVVILPFSPITLPAIVKLGNKVGIDVLPSAFREQYHLDKEPPKSGQELLELQAPDTSPEPTSPSTTKPRD